MQVVFVTNVFHNFSVTDMEQVYILVKSNILYMLVANNGHKLIKQKGKNDRQETSIWKMKSSNGRIAVCLR